MVIKGTRDDIKLVRVDATRGIIRVVDRKEGDIISLRAAEVSSVVIQGEVDGDVFVTLQIPKVTLSFDPKEIDKRLR